MVVELIVRIVLAVKEGRDSKFVKGEYQQC